MPMFAGEASGPDAAFVETADAGSGVRTTTHSYGVARDGRSLSRDPILFSDLAADPYQQDTCGDKPVAANLDEQLRAWDRDIAWTDVARRD